MIKKMILLISLLLFFGNQAKAELSIDITGAHSAPMGVGLPAFSVSGQDKGEARETARKITEVIESDLSSSGLFKILDSLAYLQSFKGIGDAPVFVDWQAISAEALIQGHVDYLSKKQIRVSVRLWDVYAAQEMYSATLEIDAKGWRRAAHMIADAVYKRITGEEGYFDTRIVYIAETGSVLNKIKRLAIMDQDGENHQFLTDGLNLVLTPRFSPNMQQITYMSYYKDTPRVYLFDIETKVEDVKSVREAEVIALTLEGKKVPVVHVVLNKEAKNKEESVLKTIDLTLKSSLDNGNAIPYAYKVRDSFTTSPISGKRDYAILAYETEGYVRFDEQENIIPIRINSEESKKNNDLIHSKILVKK